MLRLVVTIDDPTSDKVVRSRCYPMEIARNPGGGVSPAGIFNFDIPSAHSKGKDDARQTSYRYRCLGVTCGSSTDIPKRIPCENISWDLAHSISVFRAASTLSISKAF